MRAVTLTCAAALLAHLCCATSAAALHLPLSWSQASQRTLKPAVVYKQLSLDQALRSQHDGVAVLIVGTETPKRRGPNQPLLSFSQAGASQVPYTVQQLLAQAMSQLQQLGIGNSFSLQLGVLPRNAHGPAGGGPLVVFDASTGIVLLGPSVLQALQSTPVHVVSAAVQATTAAAQRLVHAAGQMLPNSSTQLLQLAPTAVAAGITAAFVGAVPKWFCFVCPIVLGLLSPLIINAGVGEAADLACKAMKLPDDECVDLWFAALGLGMILSLLSAIPIYKVCRLYECAHPGTDSAGGAPAT